MNTITLYRPVGLKEMELIAASGWSAYPPRLDWQPIFYPVLNEAYASQIARDWNTGDPNSGYCGIVTAFEIDKDHVQQYTPKNVGGPTHDELWVPAEELETFNRNIEGPIRVLNAYFGDDFSMPDNKKIENTLLKFQKKINP